MKTIQLRDYAIKPGELDRFAELWKNNVRPLRIKKGFVIEGAWKIPAEERFVWIVSFDGPSGWDAANHAYFESPERKTMSPDPASLVLKSRTCFITAI